MPQYGHTLLFGAFVTPSARAPHRLIALASLCERAGLDLLTVQDHPYHPEFLEAWTLLSYLAARTERIRVALNVANLPLRQPAVLARAVASLDRLTHGRVELGLGAGYFWDAIEALGGPRRRPREAVTALREAIDIIRGLWDIHATQPLTVEGTSYRVEGARRGPAPAHRIELWVGGYRPRMLRLIGEKADGWLPSLAYLESLDDLRIGNQLIDEAAAASGRSPTAIRRLLNIHGRFHPERRGFLVGPVSQWVEELAELALTYGVSAFILASDERSVLERFTREVAPRVRELIAVERRDGRAAPAPLRPPIVLTSGRGDGGTTRPGPITRSSLPYRLARCAILPDDPWYEEFRSVYMAEGAPAVVLLCEAVEDVVMAVEFARAYPEYPLSIRSGRHGIAGLSTNDGGIVIDLSRLDQVEVLDPEERLVRLGAGATWGRVAQELAAYGWAMTSGNYGDVGVGGLATAGGLGWLLRSQGLTIDHLVAAEVVLADGRVVQADSSTLPELFWAVRGAGHMVGVVTSVVLRVFELSDVVFATLLFDASDTATLIERWASFCAAAPDDLTSFLWLLPRRRNAPALGQVFVVLANPRIDRAAVLLTTLSRIGRLLDQQAVRVPYAGLVQPYDALKVGQQTVKIRNGFLPVMTPADADALATLLAHPLTVLVELRTMGGAARRVDPSATAFAHRWQDWFVSAWFRPASVEEQDAAWSLIAPRLQGLYAAYTSDVRPERVLEAYPEATARRLAAIKRQYDPANLFRRGLVVTEDLLVPGGLGSVSPIRGSDGER